MGQADSTDLTGKLLLAMPGIGDPRFHRAVIYICAHDENGAMGLVVNAPVPDVKFQSLLGQLGIESDIKIEAKNLELPVLNGGPVETARGFLLHSNEFRQKDTVQVDDEFSITGTTDALEAVAKGQGPEKALFILGYAGWTPGQLESELQQNTWLVADPDPNLIFEDKPQEKWTHAMNKLGLDPAMLSGEMGRA
ncbi:MAG: YqgE/AlgH family protein [Rhodospirillales bacterium]|nr:YqgE/AlgH family protein [Rhodospirillales bacterium]